MQYAPTEILALVGAYCIRPLWRQGPYTFSMLGKQEQKVFEIEGFQERMEAIKAQVRPQLEDLGRTLSPKLAKELGMPVYPHVAKHMRRTVNPPPETWVAFCLDKRAYKKHPHLAVVVGDGGVEVRLVVKDEHPNRPEVGKRLRKHKELAVEALAGAGRNGDAPLAGGHGKPVEDPEAFVKEASARLEKIKGATLSLALPVKGDASKSILPAMRKLLPLYRGLVGLP